MSAWWYDTDDRGPRGPVLPEGLKALADHGLLKPDDLVREEREGASSEWISARRLTGLFVARIVPRHVESPPDCPGGQLAPGVQDEPMIEFWPPSTVSPPIELLETRPWQFSLRDMLIAVGMAAAASGAAVMVVNSLRLAESAPWEYGIISFAGIICAIGLLGGAVGMLIGKPGRWLLAGALVGLIVAASILRLLTLLTIVGTIVLAASLDGRKKGKPNPDQVMAARQKSIYKLSAVCSVILLFLWLPIPLMVNPNGACRPMGQAMLTGLVVLPLTIIAITKAIIQLVVEWPEEKRIGLKAIVVALIPIAIYAFTQWLIVSVCGIIYED